MSNFMSNSFPRRTPGLRGLRVGAIAVLALIGLAACSKQPDIYPREMWSDAAYDVPMSVDQLAGLGWRCHPETFTFGEPYDGQCFGSESPEGPAFDVFGIPRAAASLFVANGRLKAANIGVHITASKQLALHLTQEFGKPVANQVPNGDGCKLVWSKGQIYYSLELSDSITDGYAYLYVEIGGPRPNGKPKSWFSKIVDKLRDHSCSTFE